MNTPSSGCIRSTSPKQPHSNTQLLKVPLEQEKHKKWLDHQLERWARWVHQGAVLPEGYQSIFATIAAHKNTWMRDQAGPRLPNFGTEYRIERFLLMVQPQQATAVAVLRAELGIHKECRDCFTQRQRAHRLGISLRSYAYALKRIKQALWTHLQAL